MRLGPGGRRVKDQIRAEKIAAFITEESVCNHASSVGLMSLVAGVRGSQWESVQLFKVGRSP